MNIDPHLDFETMKRVEQLYPSEYVAKTENVSITVVDLTHDRPISFRPRRLSFADKEKLSLILDQMLREQIIRPSNSPYAFSIVLVHKRNGEP